MSNVTPQQKQYMHISEWLKLNPSVKIQEYIEEYHNIINKLAYTYAHNSNYIYKNLLLEGMLGLLIAITKYKLNKNTQLKTYIYLWAKAKMLRFLENNVFKLKTISIDNNHEYKLSDILASQDNNIDEDVFINNAKTKFYSLLNSLPINQYLVITKKYLTEPSIPSTEIAKSLNISRSYVRTLEMKALKFLKENLYKIEIQN